MKRFVFVGSLAASCCSFAVLEGNKKENAKEHLDNKIAEAESTFQQTKDAVYGTLRPAARGVIVGVDYISTHAVSVYKSLETGKPEFFIFFSTMLFFFFCPVMTFCP